jgi:hypothetical protein
MLVFRSPHFAHLECALARNPYQANQYIVVFALRYGMALGREICVINDSTRPWQKLQYSPGSKHPFLWFSPPTAASEFRNDNLLLHGLLAAEPPVIQTTGRTKESSLSAGDLEAQPGPGATRGGNTPRRGRLGSSLLFLFWDRNCL